MGENNTLLCVHPDPAQLSLLEQNGYELITATNGSDGLRLFLSRPVDAIVFDYQLCLSDGSALAAEIKRVQPQLPIVMLAEDVELPDDALKFVNALVAKSDGPHFLLATVRSVLNPKPVQFADAEFGPQSSIRRQPTGNFQQRTQSRRVKTAESAMNKHDAPFSPRVWRSIRNGTLQF
jgi:DNA-binding response OmpR family regulator